MVQEILSTYGEEIITRIYHRQDPEYITRDFFKRRIIGEDLYEQALAAITKIHRQFESSRKINHI